MERDINQNFKKIWILISIVLTVFGLLFLTLVYIIIILPSLNSDDSYKLWYLLIHPFTILFYIPLFWALIISANYHLYLVYKDKNSFKAIRYLNRYYIAVCKYKKITRFSAPTIDFKKMGSLTEHNFVLENGAAVQVYFNETYRVCKKLDFIPSKSPNKSIKNHFELLPEHNHKQIQIDNKTLIPQSLTKQVNSEIIVPNFHWLIASKFIKIFEISQSYVNEKNDPIFQETLNNNFTDLAYLLSKKSFSYNKFLLNIYVLTVSQSSSRLFLRNNKKFDFYNDKYQENFRCMMQELLWESELGSEVLYFTDFMNLKLLKNKKYSNLRASINSVNEYFNVFLNDLATDKIITKFDKKDCFVRILNDSKINELMNFKRFKKPKYMKILIECFENISNDIDIRKLYLFELHKELNNEKK
ncbi:MAG4530 family protein [Mycoplasmopsis felifaucium]|uniref:Uncharacterized protein n=1 Tax=Mycoplasmopsis felifaucium TaxID=35768 RepID=A0ABZ2RQ79_9BACT